MFRRIWQKGRGFVSGTVDGAQCVCVSIRVRGNVYICTYETKPNEDSMTIRCTFFQLGQFMGFRESCSHATVAVLSICFSLASDWSCTAEARSTTGAVVVASGGDTTPPCSVPRGEEAGGGGACVDIAFSCPRSQSESSRVGSGEGRRTSKAECRRSQFVTFFSFFIL